jgi:hypothetical protein
VPGLSLLRHPASGPGACPLRPDNTVPEGEGQVPLFGVRLQAGGCPAELVEALAWPDHPPQLMSTLAIDVAGPILAVGTPYVQAMAFQGQDWHLPDPDLE